MSQERISVYNLADLKNTSDDAIPNYLNSLGFVQSHQLGDVRLGLGYGALAVAGACFVWDFKLGFADTKYYSAAAVVVYMALHGALWLWTHFVEKTTVYEGARGDDVVSIATAVEKHDPVYRVTVVTRSKKSPTTTTATTRIHRAFSEWFDSAGHFVAPPFQSMLATEVAAIGRADPKRAQKTATTTATTTAPQYDAKLLDVLATASVQTDGAAAATTGSSSGSSAKKGGKRRKAA